MLLPSSLLLLVCWQGQQQQHWFRLRQQQRMAVRPRRRHQQQGQLQRERGLEKLQFLLMGQHMRENTQMQDTTKGEMGEGPKNNTCEIAFCSR